jgi:uncharacterized protein YbjT (DUF2867 family)
VNTRPSPTSGDDFAAAARPSPTNVILVTGASGKTGQAVVAALARAGASTRALVRRPAQMKVLTDLGASEAIVADMRLPLDLSRC